jgi:hypothetical protein
MDELDGTFTVTEYVDTPVRVRTSSIGRSVRASVTARPGWRSGNIARDHNDQSVPDFRHLVPVKSRVTYPSESARVGSRYGCAGDGHD